MIRDLEMIIIMNIKKLLVKRTLTGDDLIERLFVIYDFCPVINIHPSTLLFVRCAFIGDVVVPSSVCPPYVCPASQPVIHSAVA